MDDRYPRTRGANRWGLPRLRTLALVACAPALFALTPVGASEAHPSATGDWTVPLDVLDRTPLIDPIETNWRTLLGLDYRTGEVRPELEALRGKVVKIPGFMVPFEDGVDGVNEFLLVPYFGACIHTPPPPPNQIVYVRMTGGRNVPVNIWDAIWIEGVLDIESIESPYGSVGHQVMGERIHPYGQEN